jgi:hypothetical protein
MGLQGRRAGASANDDLDDWQQALSFDVSGGAAPPPTPPTPTPPPPPVMSETDTAVTVVAVDGVAGWTTVQLTVTLDATMDNVYAMAGTADTTMSFPPAYQVAAPFGADIGGVNPGLFQASPEAEFDSYLTVGVTDGSAAGAIAGSPGFDLGTWTETTGVSEDNAAVFWMDPTQGPSGADIVMAQLTLSAADAASGSASCKLQGAVAGSTLTWQHSATWTWAVDPSTVTPPPPPPTPTPPTPTPTPPTPTPPTPAPVGGIAGAIDSVSTDGVAGMTTVRLSITLDATQTNVYAMAGTADIPMSFPAAYQCATPFGADIGGANPQFFAIANNAALGYAEFDSWLTIGVTDGSAPGAITASPGFDLGTWTDSAGISQDNAAIFFMDPATMGANSGTDPIVMAQMTVSAETVAGGGTATAKLQGRSVGDGVEDWGLPVSWTW